MQLFRTVCSTDFKSRPSHGLILVGTSVLGSPEFNKADRIEALKDLMDKDVRDWQAHDIAAEETEDGTFDTKRIAELINDKDLPLLWKHVDRFEMQLTDEDHREFVERMDGDRTTVVYHFFGD